MAALGIGRGDQRCIMTRATQENVEGSWQVLKAWPSERRLCPTLGLERGRENDWGRGQA